MSFETLAGDVWRIGLSLAILGALLLFWYVALSNVTPFAHSYTPSEIEREKKREAHYTGIRNFSVKMDVIFFVWLVVEGAFLVPWLFLRYGMAP